MSESSVKYTEGAFEILERIASENASDPARDDMTVPLAIEAARLEAINADMLAALKIVAQHGRIDDSEARMNMVVAAIVKAEGR